MLLPGVERFPTPEHLDPGPDGYVPLHSWEWQLDPWKGTRRPFDGTLAVFHEP